MTVKELKELLNQFDDNMEVVMKAGNTSYVDGIFRASERRMTAFYGDDRQVVVIVSDGQQGAV